MDDRARKRIKKYRERERQDGLPNDDAAARWLEANDPAAAAPERAPAPPAAVEDRLARIEEGARGRDEPERRGRPLAPPARNADVVGTCPHTFWATIHAIGGRVTH